MPTSRFQTLLVEGSPRRRQALEGLLSARRGQVASRTRSSSALRFLADEGADLVLVGADLPDRHAILKRAAESGLDVELLFEPEAPDPGVYLGRTRFGTLKFGRQILQACGTWWELQNAEVPVHERYRKLLNRVRDGLLELGPDDTVRWANAAMRRALDTERLEGLHLEELVEERDVMCLRAVREQQRGGVIAPFLVRLRNGPAVEVDPTPRFGPDGAYLGTSALVRLGTPQNGQLEASRVLVTLYSLASQLSRAFGLDDVLQVVLDATRHLGAYDAAGVSLGTGRTETQSAEPLSPSLAEAIQAFGHRLEPTRNIRIIRDSERDADFAASALMTEGYRALAVVPLAAGDDRLGVLWALSRHSEGFGRESNSLLISIGAQAGVAVQNALHFEARLEEEAGRRRFYRDALQAATKGKLVLSEYDELEEHWSGAGHLRDTMLLQTGADVPEARRRVEEALQAEDFPADRSFNLVTCVSEAATNVVKYGPPGTMQVRSDDTAMRVRMDDVGPGIEFDKLPDAVLMPGFSTAPSLGLGYTVLLELCDRVHLATGEQGTRLILEMARRSADPLDAFLGLAGALED